VPPAELATVASTLALEQAVLRTPTAARSYEERQLPFCNAFLAAAGITIPRLAGCDTTSQDLLRQRFQYQVCVSDPGPLVACPFGRSAETTCLRGRHGQSVGSRSQRLRHAADYAPNTSSRKELISKKVRLQELTLALGFTLADRTVLYAHRDGSRLCFLAIAAFLSSRICSFEYPDAASLRLVFRFMWFHCQLAATFGNMAHKRNKSCKRMVVDPIAVPAPNRILGSSNTALSRAKLY
jgi:hypothetical protein